ncbi:capsular polysaccharide biosynthesis protein [Achromobacter marplatensis]|nr:capsular polysaccharide biosynthesis protein [Achromobacter marplatensis]
MAIGDRFSAAFTSLEHALNELGDVTYLHEKTFEKAEDSVEHVRNSSFDVAVMPNPYGNEKRLWVYRHLVKAGFPVVVFDRGALPDSWFFDVGFNADSPTYKISTWDKPLQPEQAIKVNDYVAKFLDTKPLENQGEYNDPLALKTALGIQGKRVLFVAYQRPADTTIKNFAGRIQTYANFCRLVDEVNAELSRQKSDWVIIAKKHPLETARPGSSVRFAPDNTNINSLIQMADMVFVVNSGVGVIASLFDKPVLIAGDAFYAHNGMNRSVGTVHEILYYLEKGFEFDPETRDRFIYHLIDRVYSFASFETEKVKQKDGSFRNITRKINFRNIVWPPVVKKKSCLFVSSVLPIPVNRGNAQRTDQFISAFLELGYRVRLVLLNQSEASARSTDIARRTLAHYNSAFLSVQVRKHPMFALNARRKSKGLEKVIAAAEHYVRSKISTITGDYAKINSSESFPRRFRQLVALESQKKHDVSWVNYAKLYDASCYSGRVIVDLHDVQVNRIKADVLPKIPEAQRDRYLKIASESERGIMASAGMCVSISPVETEHIKLDYCPTANVKTIKATDFGHKLTTLGSKFDLLFIGSNSDPNVAGLLWFLEEVWPILNLEAGVNLKIQGNITRNPKIQRAITAAVRSSAIHAGGFVKDLGDVYKSASVVICPIRYGTGMKIKVVEAMSYGMPIVATTAALEGISDAYGINAVDSPEEFAAEIQAMLGSDINRMRASERSWATFEADHSREYLLVELDSLLAEANA